MATIILCSNGLRSLIMKINELKNRMLELKKYKLSYSMETVKISGTKWYIDVEYKGQIVRFGGDICLDGFAATVSSMGWIRHIGSPHDGEKEELMRAVYKYSKTNKKSRVRFYDDNGNEIKFD